MKLRPFGIAVPILASAIGCEESYPPLEPPPGPHLNVGLQSVSGRIAFGSDRDGNSEIYVMNPVGSGQTNVSNDPQPDFQPAWSPGGSRIAFSRIDQNGNQNIWVMNADGSAQQKLNTVDGGEPSWSPDGSRIAFTSFTLHPDGSGVTRLTTAPGYDGNPEFGAGGVGP